MLELALQRNVDFRLASLHVEEARASYSIKRSTSLPTVSIQAQRQRMLFDSAEMNERNKEDYVSADVGITDFELDFFGKLKSMTEAAHQRYIASEHGGEAARGTLIAEVLRAYAHERSSLETLKHLQEADVSQAARMIIASRQLSVGLISREQFDQRHTDAQAAHVATQQATDDHGAALRALHLLVGADFTPVDGNVAELVAEDVPVEALRNLDSRVLLQRPDIQEAEAELQARNADIGAARAAFFPSIRLSTGIGTVSENLSNLFKGGSGVWLFNPLLNLPIFDGGLNRANLTLAELRKEAGIAEYEKAIQSAFRETADALASRTTTMANVALRRRQFEIQQQKTSRIAERVKQGLRDRSELLDEELMAHTFYNALVAAELDQALNRIRLLHAFYGVALPIAEEKS